MPSPTLTVKKRANRFILFGVFVSNVIRLTAERVVVSPLPPPRIFLSGTEINTTEQKAYRVLHQQTPEELKCVHHTNVNWYFVDMGGTPVLCPDNVVRYKKNISSFDSEYTALLQLRNLTETGVGLYICAQTKNSNCDHLMGLDHSDARCSGILSSVYVYLKGENVPLLVSNGRGRTSIQYRRDEEPVWVPCKPTRPGVSLVLRDMAGQMIPGKLDPQRGIQLPLSESSTSFKCVATEGNVTATRYFLVSTYSQRKGPTGRSWNVNAVPPPPSGSLSPNAIIVAVSTSLAVSFLFVACLAVKCGRPKKGQRRNR